MKILQRCFILTVLTVLSCADPVFTEYQKKKAGSPLTSPEFNYQTVKVVNLHIDTHIPSVKFSVLFEDKLVHEAVSDSEGNVKTSLTLPSYAKIVVINTDFPGLVSSVETGIINNTINVDYNNLSSPLLSRNAPRFNNGNGNGGAGNTSSDYNVLGSWNSAGVPDYLIEGEEISAEFLMQLNSALPEHQPVPEYNPQYLENTAYTSIDIVEEGEIFVTFVHEGAGYKNALAFHSFLTSEGIPLSLVKSDLTIIFPNVSYSGSGGGLSSGDRVSLGVHPAGTTIIWALVANGFSDGDVGDGNATYYSVDELNPEDSENNQHVVQIDFGDRVVFSFEDLPRPSGDNDFNDAIFTVTSNPLSAISTTDIIDVEESPTLDSDGDGVTDTNDAEPDNPAVASRTFIPSETGYGTLAFEDLWPFKGDYDFNDLVLDYRFTEYVNGEGKISSVKGEFIIRGLLASMHNGFALALDALPQDILSVTGARYDSGYMDLFNSGSEKRQEYAVITVFEDAHNHFTEGETELIKVVITFVTPLTREELGYAPYNPFIISNGERGREVHLPGYQATDLAHLGYFGAEDDRSIPGTEYMYKAENEHPWALHLPVSFDFPQDDVEIDRVYNHFFQWVESGGLEYSDWYLDKEGYRNPQYLY